MKLNSRLVVVFVALLVVMQIAAPHKIWGILMIGLGGALALAFFWASGLEADTCNFERDIRSHLAKVGDQLQERFVISNQEPFPGTLGLGDRLFHFPALSGEYRPLRRW